MAVDINGKELKVGDIVTAVVKYKVVEVRSDSVLAQKIYDVPQQALTFFKDGEKQ